VSVTGSPAGIVMLGVITVTTVSCPRGRCEVAS